MKKHISNPYIAGAPVHGRNFVGREELIRRTEHVIDSQSSPIIAIFGQRRIGKTSFLLNLSEILNSKGYICIFIDLLGMQQVTVREIQEYIAREIIAKLDSSIDIDDFAFDDDGIEFEKKFLKKLGDTTSLNKRRLIILFDELESFYSDVIEEQRETVKQFSKMLLRWFGSEKTTQIICSIGLASPNFVSTDLLFLLRVSTQLKISFLNYEETKKLIGISQEVKFDDSAIDRIYELTHGHPYLLQSMCFQLFYEAVESDDKKSISKGDVEKVEQKVIQSSEAALHWMFLGLSQVEQAILTIMVQLSLDKTVATDEKLFSKLEKYNLAIGTIKQSLNHLVELEIIISREGGYRFAVPLFEKWVARSSLPITILEELNYEVRETAQQITPNQFGVERVPASKRRRKRFFQILSLIFLEIPRIAGQFLLDIFGRESAKSQSAIILGYVVIIIVIVILIGSVSIDTIIKLFTEIWRFFFPST